ncbi:acyl-CoA desaturase [Engelhardtia mirabilis]|uniref:Fatty acid desaturase n=1 Tax=Engelhardtia mirabilis TaxID=2528011 RepID=A0A518BFI8_9BACT|nr:Fatty acid desaturase [Planctomycetes bacterium Pla133]QDV00070.1 Fatty acid desaturase [Planctomycetes bacterium Pla86]
MQVERTAPPVLWTNTIFLGLAHAVAAYAVVHLFWIGVSPWTLALAGLWFVLCGLGITGGYHRLFAHRTFRASAPVRLLALLFGAASVQNSALDWAADHRQHHNRADKHDDPYSIHHGFWWAHMGWVMHQGPTAQKRGVHDLERDPLVVWQDRYYGWIALAMGAVLPTSLGLLWGDPLGAFLIAGFLRLVLQWHATFAINSFTHRFGSRPYDPQSTARDSWWTALVTFGEGYHNFHHRFPTDYRNGVRWYHFDPTKWTVWTLSRVGLTKELRRTPRERIRSARDKASAA